MATAESWQAFYDEYTAKMNEKYGADSPTPATRQEQEDLAKQQLFQGWLENQMAEINRTGEVPETVDMNLTSGSGGWYQLDGVSRFGTYTWKKTPSWTSGIPAGTNFSFAIAQDFKLDFRLNPVSSGYYHTTVQDRYVADGGIMGDFGFISTLPCMPSILNYSAGAYDIYPLTATVQYQPRNFISTNTYYPTDYMAAGGWIFAGGFGFTNEERDGLTNPWDYYNDNLLPSLNPDNAVIPGGYEPQEPPDPDDDNPGDEPDVTDSEGEIPELQFDTLVSTPMNFITQYILTASEVSAIGLNLWSSWLDQNTTVQKNFLFDFFQDTGTFDITAALDFVVSLRVYPFDVRSLLSSIGTCNGVYMGTGHTNFLPSPQGASVWYVASMIHSLFAGTCKVYPNTPYKDFRDIYNTTVTAFLPFCGLVELNPAEVMYKELNCYYLIDFGTGGCTAVITVKNDNGSYIVASKSGQIGFLIPITATNSGQVAAQSMRDATNAIGKIGGFFFDAATSIANSAEQLAKAAAKAEENGEDFKGTGMTASSSIGIGKKGFNTFLDLANQGINMLSRSCIDVPMLSGGGGMEALQFTKTPYIQIRRGWYNKPDNYPHSVGYLNGSSNTISYYAGMFSGEPTYPNSTSSPKKGLCKFTGIDTSGLTCHADERAEIVALLESGVYI
jgi:hypothetical protein